jgi:predicted GNAT family acetyltransferase
MKIERYSAPRDFLQRAEAWLLTAEPENNLILGVARRYEDQDADGAAGTYWVTITSDHQVVGTSFRTPPHHLSVSGMPRDAVPLLVGHVAAVYPDLSGVVGPADVAERFASLWTRRFGGEDCVKVRLKIHVLREVRSSAAVTPGLLRRMEPKDAELIMEWVRGFVAETGIIGPAERVAAPGIANRKFYLWDDDGPRSIVASSRDTPNGACINAVYTPPAYRQSGYASAAVAALTEKLLAAGKEFCCLYTDMANPTSNSMYRKIGYRPLREDVEIEFKPESASSALKI